MSKYPTNMDYWRFILVNPEKVLAFIKRGDDRQHSEIKSCLKYWKILEPELFKKINGQQILKQLKELKSI